MSTRRYKGTSGRIYESIEHIGPGGFGAVERVGDDDGNECALKTLHLGFDPDVVDDEQNGAVFLDQLGERPDVVGQVDVLVQQKTEREFVGVAVPTGVELKPLEFLRKAVVLPESTWTRAGEGRGGRLARWTP